MRIIFMFLLAQAALAQDLSIFAYRPTSEALKLEVRKATDERIIYDGTLQIKDPVHGEKLQVSFEYFRNTKATKAPLVFVFPPITRAGLPNVIEAIAARKFSSAKSHAIIVHLSESITDPSRSIASVDDFFIRSTVSFRHLVDKFSAREEVISDQLNVYGISLGGIRASLAHSVEPRIKKAFLCVAAGNIPLVLGRSIVRPVRAFREAKMSSERLHNEDQFIAALEATLNIDPLDYAPHRSDKEVFMITAKKDVHVPYQGQEELVQAYGKPKVLEYNYGHIITGAMALVLHDTVEEFFGF